MTWVTYLTGTLAPPWLRGIWGTKWVQNTYGEEKDRLQGLVVESVTARMPSRAPSGGLVYLGTERGIERAFAETDSAYRPRLKAAWETWQWSGTTYGVLQGVGAAGWTVATFDPTMTWPSDWPADGKCWIVNNSQWMPPDGNRAKWNRFWVVLDYYGQTGLTAPAKLRGSSVTRGTTIRGPYEPLTLDEANRLKRVIRKWKGAYSTCPTMFLILSTGSWEDIRGPFTTRGPARTRGGSVVPITVDET